jgi:hypothetical protein
VLFHLRELVFVCFLIDEFIVIFFEVVRLTRLIIFQRKQSVHGWGHLIGPP